jgi:uncharacterized protein
VVIYLDSAAVVKLLRVEPASAELVAWLGERRDATLLSSALVEVEVPRALRRTTPMALPAVPATIGRLYRLEIDSSVRATAAAFTAPLLRSLDAIHLATALQVVTELEAFVTYDERLLKAAGEVGLPVASPGVAG